MSHLRRCFWECDLLSSLQLEGLVECGTSHHMKQGTSLFRSIGDHPIGFSPSTFHHSHLPAEDPSSRSQTCMGFTSKKLQWVQSAVSWPLERQGWRRRLAERTGQKIAASGEWTSFILSVFMYIVEQVTPTHICLCASTGWGIIAYRNLQS